nr:hypothetical protein [Nitrosomonas nitrosa]
MCPSRNSSRPKRRRLRRRKITLWDQAAMAADLLGEDAEQWYRDLLSARRLRRRLQAAMAASKSSTISSKRRPKGG